MASVIAAWLRTKDVSDKKWILTVATTRSSVIDMEQLGRNTRRLQDARPITSSNMHNKQYDVTDRRKNAQLLQIRASSERRASWEADSCSDVEDTPTLLRDFRFWQQCLWKFKPPGRSIKNWRRFGGDRFLHPQALCSWQRHFGAACKTSYAGVIWLNRPNNERNRPLQRVGNYLPIDTAQHSSKV